MKKTGRKSSLTVPLKRIRKHHLTRCSMILRRTWLSAVWYCAELDSAQYDTAQNFEKIRISRQNLIQKQNYYNPFVVGPGRFEWYKTRGSKISLYCPYKNTYCKKKFINGSDKYTTLAYIVKSMYSTFNVNWKDWIIVHYYIVLSIVH